jgi:hypothetical protein
VLGIWFLALGANVQIEAPRDCDIRALTALEVDDAITVTATISANGAFHGTVSVRANGRVFPARTVGGERCEQVSEALALIAELAIDRLPKPDPPPSIAAHAIAPAAAMRTAIHPLGLEPTWHVSAGVHGAASFGRAPSWRPSVPPFVELARDPLSLRASLLWSYAHGTELRVTQLAAKIDVCPFHFVIDDFEADPCATLEIGAIRGSSEQANVGLWLAPGLTARGRWRFAHPFFAEVEAGASFPILRPRFLLEPEQTLWHAAPIAFSAGAGVGATIW